MIYIFTGPESTGKSTLSRKVATRHQGVWIPEYARTYLNRLSGDYTAEDVLQIARGQQYSILQAIRQHPYQDIFVDTGLVVTYVWQLVRYEKVHPWIIEQLTNPPYSAHFYLCKPDIPWEADPLREHPEARDELYQQYLQVMDKFSLDYTIVDQDERSKMSIS